MSSRVLPVTAYGVAETINPRVLAEALGDFATPVELTRSTLLLHLGEDVWAAVHDFGAIVFVGATPDGAREWLERLSRAATLRSRPRLGERFTLEVKSDAPPSVHFDRVVLPAADPAQLVLITHVVGQSVALEYAETEVDGLLTETEARARKLASAGARGLSARALLPFVGRAMTSRTQAVLTLALLDAPATVWESEPLDRLHRSLRAAFDIDERFRGLDYKLRVVQENMALLVDLAQHRRSAALEVAVIALIAFELVVGLWSRH